MKRKNTYQQRRMGKKGQAAMEFLMTYGWAILVVIGAIGALAYFGVLSPTKFLPEKCILPSGTPCLDSTMSATGLSVVVQNSAGFGMTGVSLAVAGTGCTGNGNGTAALSNGDKATYVFTCNSTSGSKYKGTLYFVYTNSDTGLVHNASGELIKQVS